MVLGSSPAAVTSPSDFATASSKEFLDIQATIECVDSLWNAYVIWQEHRVSLGGDSSFISEESDKNIFNRSDNVAVANSDVEIIDVNKFKAEVPALKMFVTKQLYIVK